MMETTSTLTPEKSDLSPIAGMRHGITRALPLAMGYIPVGFTFGMMAQGVGFHFAYAMLMSLLVYAGSSQILAINLLSGGAGIGSIIIATFVINLRHLLFSSALAPRLGFLRKSQLALFCFSLSDEAFALHNTAFREKSLGYGELMGVNITLHLAWLLGTALSFVVQLSPQAMESIGLDYAPIAMFIGLCAMLARTPLEGVVTVMSGVLACICRIYGLGVYSILWATLIAATFGYGVVQWKTARS